MDPMVQKYLDEMEQQKQKNAALQDRSIQLAQADIPDYSSYAALSNAAAQLGTIGGKSADTSSVNQAAKGFTDQAMQSRKQALGALADRQDSIDKNTGLNLKTLEYLQSRKDRSQNRNEDLAFRNKQLAQQREIAGLTDQRARDLAKTSSPSMKAPNADQFKAAGFAKRVEQANKAFEQLASKGYDRTSGLEGFKSSLPDPLNSFKGTELQQQEQAERNFLNAVLRRESGAAIGDSERSEGALQYFPRTGDSPDALALKAQNRMQAFNTLKAEGSNAYDQIPSAELATVAKPGQEGVAFAAGVPPAGDTVMMRAPNGSLKRVPKDKVQAALAAGGKLEGQ